MTAKHWIQILTLTSALAVTGTAAADDMKPTRPDSRNGVADTPSAGAIVTPEDKALGMGKDHEGKSRSGERDADESPNDNASSDEGLTVDPGRSNDDASSVNPGPSDDDAIVRPAPADDQRVGIKPRRTVAN